MQPNRDIISKPSNGKFFGLSSPELIGLIRQFDFSHSVYQNRIDIGLFNTNGKASYGTLAGAFSPGDFLAIYSFPKTISPVRGKLVQIKMISEFSVIDRQPPAGVNYYRGGWSRSRHVISFRAYLGKLNKIIITERHRCLRYGKYRQGSTFRHHKPNSIRVDERLLYEIELT